MTEAEMAEILGITEDGSRQHLHRARGRLDRATEHTQSAIHDASLERFLAALEDGDLAQVQDLLAADVVSYSDGGGKARAARRPVIGARDVVQYLGALRRRLPVLDVRDGEIGEIQWIMNPDKLRYLHRQLADPPA
jgi:hypothetical protein